MKEICRKGIKLNIVIDKDDEFSKDLLYIKEFDPDFDLGLRIQKILDKYLNYENKQGLVFIVKDKVRFRKDMGGYRGAVPISDSMEAWWSDGHGFYFINLHDPDMDPWNIIFAPEGHPWCGGIYE